MASVKVEAFPEFLPHSHLVSEKEFGCHRNLFNLYLQFFAAFIFSDIFAKDQIIAKAPDSMPAVRAESRPLRHACRRSRHSPSGGFMLKRSWRWARAEWAPAAPSAGRRQGPPQYQSHLKTLKFMKLPVLPATQSDI